MCGIFGLVSNNLDAPRKTHDGLIALQYRGYDSFGIASSINDKLQIRKRTGAPDSVAFKDLGLNDSNRAVGHSRWATHGIVCKKNAHPHANEVNSEAIVHNGIIENHLALKGDLIEKGHVFTSDTDSEVIVHLVEEELKETTDLSEAFRLALKKLEGRFAILLISNKDDRIYAAREGSPLVIGRAKGEIYVSSDPLAFLHATKIVNYLDDGEMAIIEKARARFFKIDNNEQIKKRDIVLDIDFEDAEKGDYAHFMIKEIWDQRDTIVSSVNQDDAQIMEVAEIIKKAKGVFLVGCGTALKACSVGEYFFAKAGKIHTNAVVASEFANFEYFLADQTLMIVVSQSGETADVLEAIKIAKRKGVKILALVNVASSTIAREADYVFNINAGVEKAVASTKATTAQMALLLLIAYAVDNRLDTGKQLLIDTAGKIAEILNPRYLERVKSLASALSNRPNIFIIGKGYNYPMAMEAAIKIMEVSYMHAQGFAAGELKHGPIAMIEKGVPVIALCANDENWESIQSNCEEVKSRGAFVVGVGPTQSEIFDDWLRTPVVSLAQPIVNIIPIQILAYYLAINLGLDPDMPRNLAKSVTVK